MDRVDLYDGQQARSELGAGVDFSLVHRGEADGTAAAAPDGAAAGDAGRPIDLRALWNELLAGSFDVVDSFCSDSRCFLVLQEARPEKRKHARAMARKLRILEAAALGVGQKVSAAEFGLAVSTVSFATRQAMAFLGFSVAKTKLPLILTVLAYAARAQSPCFGKERRTMRRGVTSRVISVERPDLSLAARLPPSEYEVTRLFVEGRSHAEIARRRRTSRRTIANQLASVFHRLRISGRSELLTTVVVEGAGLSWSRSVE